MQFLNVTNSYWRRIEKIILHKGFKGDGFPWYGNDIALIKLEPKGGTKVPNGTIIPVCLPTKEFEDVKNESLYMAGYGRRRIPHCLTDAIGPEKFQVCGREEWCAQDHITRNCTLLFRDSAGAFLPDDVNISPTCPVFHWLNMASW